MTHEIIPRERRDSLTMTVIKNVLGIYEAVCLKMKEEMISVQNLETDLFMDCDRLFVDHYRPKYEIFTGCDY